MNKLQEIKLLSDCLKTICRYKNTPPPGLGTFVTPESVSIKNKEEKLVKKLMRQLIELRGYIIFETVTSKKVAPYTDDQGISRTTKYTKHRIKALSYEDAWGFVESKFPYETKNGRMRIVG